MMSASSVRRSRPPPCIGDATASISGSMIVSLGSAVADAFALGEQCLELRDGLEILWPTGGAFGTNEPGQVDHQGLVPKDRQCRRMRQRRILDSGICQKA